MSVRKIEKKKKKSDLRLQNNSKYKKPKFKSPEISRKEDRWIKTEEKDESFFFFKEKVHSKNRNTLTKWEKKKKKKIKIKTKFVKEN